MMIMMSVKEDPSWQQLSIPFRCKRQLTTEDKDVAGSRTPRGFGSVGVFRREPLVLGQDFFSPPSSLFTLFNVATETVGLCE